MVQKEDFVAVIYFITRIKGALKKKNSFTACLVNKNLRKSKMA